LSYTLRLNTPVAKQQVNNLLKIILAGLARFGSAWLKPGLILIQTWLKTNFLTTATVKLQNFII